MGEKIDRGSKGYGKTWMGEHLIDSQLVGCVVETVRHIKLSCYAQRSLRSIFTCVPEIRLIQQISRSKSPFEQSILRPFFLETTGAILCHFLTKEPKVIRLSIYLYFPQ